MSSPVVERWTRKVPYGHLDSASKPDWVNVFFESHHRATSIKADYPWTVGDTLALHADGSVTVERATTDRAEEASDV